MVISCNSYAIIFNPNNNPPIMSLVEIVTTGDFELYF